MTLSRREFLHLLACGTAAGMGLARYADADAATAEAALYDVPRFGNVSLLHMTDCHAQLKPIYFREPSVNLGVGDMSGRLPHLVGEHLLKAAEHPARHRPRARLHLPRLRARRAPLRQGRRLRASRHAGEAHEGEPPRRAAARRRRHLAGFGDVAVDQRPGHGRRVHGARRRRDDRPLGVHLRPGPRQGDRREDLRRPHRVRRAERQDHRLRRPGVQALRDPRDQRRAGGDHRPGLSVHADRQSALLRLRLDLRHPGRQPAGDGRRGARQGRAGRGRALAQRHGRRPQDGDAGERRRCDPRRPYPRRRADPGAGEQRRRRAPSSPTPARTASSSA